jgi:hypothetical protein
VSASIKSNLSLNVYGMKFLKSAKA